MINSLISVQLLSRTIFILLISLFSFSPIFNDNAMPLNQTEVEQKIKAIPEWQQKEQTITRTFVFKNFVEAISLVNQLVEPSEAVEHHPDLEITYNTVIVSLSSHDDGGLTQKDFELAKTISAIAP